MSRFLSTLVSLSLGGAIAIILLALWAHFSRTQYAAKWRCMVWIFGVMCILGRALIVHIRFLRFLRRWSRPVCDRKILDTYQNLCQTVQIVHGPRLRICAGIKVPMLAGFFRPVLLLPEEKLESETLRYVMLHERVHFKRKDIWLKTLALVANCLHWFNPMMWLLTHLVERDTELACDETVLTYLSAQEYKIYGKTILDAVEQLHTTQRTNDKRRKMTS